jgi:hypothetical protein
MAKRPTARSKASDTAAPAEPKPKAKRARAAAPADTEQTPAAAEPTQATAAEQNPIGPPAVEPSDEEIRRRAYERYQQRGGDHGQHFDDWLEAERELKGMK